MLCWLESKSQSESKFRQKKGGVDDTWRQNRMQKRNISANVMKTGEATPLHTHTCSLFFSLCQFFFSSSLVSVPSVPWCMAFSYSGSFKVQLVMSLILFMLYGCSVWGKKSQGDDVRREWRREREEPRKESGGYGVAEEDFQCSCMYNEWGGTLFETPARRFTSRFAGQSGGSVIAHRPSFLSCQ